MSINSPTGILDVTNATIRAGKLESTGDITCSSNLVVSGGFDLSAINSNADTVVDFTATRQLRKYPREVLANNQQNSHVVTTQDIATGHVSSTAYKAFNEIDYGTNDRWFSYYNGAETDRYDTSTGAFASATYDYTLSSASGTPNGEWLAIQFPEAFTLDSFSLTTRGASNMSDAWVVGESPRDFTVWASNDGTAWTKVFEIEDADAPNGESSTRTFYTSGATTAYNRYAIIVTRNGSTYPGASGRPVVTIGELRYYGYGQDGDGQDVRLRAHANAPNTDFLEVHFDANVVGSYPGSGTTLTDVSGEAHHATLNNGVGFDSAYGALTFNGSNQNVNTQALGISGDFVHTASLWVKPAVDQSALSSTDYAAFFYIGEEPNTAATQAIAISYRKDELRYWFGANDVDVTTDFKANEWVHLAVVYRGGGGTAVNKDVYVNGVKQRYLRTDGSSYGNALNVQSTAFLRLGAAWGTNAAPYQDFNGSIANFRLFKRPLIEAEIHQLYDWEKVRFGRVALGDVVAFRDGSLGVGVAEPSRDDRLVVDGRAKADSVKTPVVVDRNSVVVYEQTGPHDRPLVKYPEVLASATNVTTTGLVQTWAGYTSTTSSSGVNDGGRLAYDGIFNTVNPWISASGTYETTGGTATSSDSFESTSGSFLKLTLPNKIRLSHVCIYNRDSASTKAPKNGIIWGSDDGGTTFSQIRTFSNLDPTRAMKHTLHITSTNKYDTIVVQITAIQVPDSGTYDQVAIQELELYGTEEGDVSTDSTWTSVLNKPGTQQLEVYWDGADSNSYPGAGTEVVDLSGNGVKGTLTNNTTFDSTYDAWKWNATGPSGITGSLAVSGGDWAHSFSYWMKVHSLPSSSVDYLFGFASAAAYSAIAHYIDTSGQLVVGSWTLDYPVENFTIPVGEWFHVVVAYQGGGFSPNVNAKTYINGKLMNMGANLSSGTDGTALTVPTTAQVIYFGYGYGGTATQPDATAGPFRMYSKALSLDQVRELYAYDAVRFGHRASNSVSLHKGNLGVGVTLPTSRFEVAGADGLFEYPPRDITQPGTSYTGYRLEEYIDGHGLFVVDGTASYNAGGADRRSWAIFSSSEALTYHGSYYLTSGTPAAWDETSTLANNNENIDFYTRLSSGGTISGDWVQLELPHKIRLKHNEIKNHNILTRSAAKGYIVASNDGHTFDVLNTITDFGYTETYQEKAFETDTDKYYRIYRLLFTHKKGGDSNLSLNMGRWRLFGTPAPSTLDDGHLTLGKALTLPRVSGHPAGAETPRAESLHVHYDTTVDSVVSGTTVVDTSGNGINPVMQNGLVYSSSERALVFDGTDDRTYISSVNNGSGAWVHSISLWCKSNSAANDSTDTFVFIGEKSSYKCIGLETQLNGNIRYYFWGSDGDTPTGSFTRGVWHHVAMTYDGGSSTTSKSVYIDGVKQTLTQSGGTTALNLNANDEFLLGCQQGGTKPLDGSISNFKLWDVALTADEVAAEYALGRTSKTINITDTAVCIGGTAPRAQLDVRGEVRGQRARFDEIEAPLSTIKKYDASLTMSSGTWHDIGDFGSPPMANGAYLLTVRWTNSNNSTTWYGGASGIIYIRGDGLAVYNAQGAEDLRLNHWYHYRTVAEFEFKLDSDNSGSGGTANYGNTTLYVKGQSNPTIPFRTYMTLLHGV